MLIGELGSLIDALAAADIPAMPFKGPVAGALAWENPVARAFGDLDVFVRPADVRRAVQLLRSRGYVVPAFADMLDRPGALPSEGQFLLRQPERSVDVELHWQLMQRFHGYSMSPESLLADGLEVRVAGRSFETFSLEHSLLTLCLHHGKHRYERILWLRDVAGLIDARSACAQRIDWASLRDTARSIGAWRSVLLAARLAGDLLDARPPEEVRRQARGDRHVTRLAEDVLRGIDHGGGRLSPIADRVEFHLRSRERVADRIRYAIFRATTPTLEDRDRIRLPASLGALHYVIRPFRLVLKRLVRS